MEKELYGMTKWIKEEDFEKRKTNTYAFINDTYFMKVNRRIPEELYSIEGIFSFYYCRVRKIADKQYKIEGRGITHKVYEHRMDASQYLSIYDEDSISNRVVRFTLYQYGDYPIVTSSYIDKSGDIHRFVSPVFEDDFLVHKTKKLSLKN